MIGKQKPLPLQPPQMPFDVQKWIEDVKRQDAYRSHDRWDSIFDSLNEAAIKASEIALRTAILINGGAAVSVLAFIGGLASKDIIKIDRLSDIANSLLLFALGVALATAGIAFSYCTHYLSAGVINTYSRAFVHPYVTSGPKTSNWILWRNITHLLGFIAGIASLGFFIWGMLSVRAAITHLG